MSDSRFTVRLEREEAFRFTVEFDQEGVSALLVDEPLPLGGGAGPNPTRLLGAAIGDCLAASLLFCLQKARVPVDALEGTVEGTVVRNEQGRLRIGGIQVRLEPSVAPEHRDAVDRCLDVFEDYCIVTQSVRRGIDVQVAVEPTTVEGDEAADAPAVAATAPAS